MTTNLLQQARQLLHSKEFGQAFALFLLAGKSVPKGSEALLRDEFKDEFMFCTQHWFKCLISLGHLKETFDCMETSLDIFQSYKIEILHMTARILFDQYYGYEAANLLTTAFGICPTILDIKEDLHEMINSLVSRWHFRMLNDKDRNEMFFKSIKKAITKGYCIVLDIGSGTGILSVFAAFCGAKEIYACETSQLIHDISKDVVKANKFERQIHLINEMSTDIDIGNVVTSRLPLLVTEIFDCGLLGEGIIPTLLHAWKNLLVPSDHDQIISDTNDISLPGKVIPCRAKVFVAAVESLELRRHKRTNNVICELNLEDVILFGNKDPGDISEQPYTTEKMCCIKNGYKTLSESVKIWEFDFNNPEHLESQVGKSHIIDMPVINEGILDAFMLWFELQLDEEITISTSPESNTCWEQAIYNARLECRCCHVKDIAVTKGSSINLQVTCTEDFLDIKIEKICQSTKERIITTKDTEHYSLKETEPNKRKLFVNNDENVRISTDSRGSLDKLSCCCTCFNVIGFEEHMKHGDEEDMSQDFVSHSSIKRQCRCRVKFNSTTDRRTIARINDDGYSYCYSKAFEELAKCSTDPKEELQVICLSTNLSLIPMLLAKIDNIKVTILLNSEEDEIFYQCLAKENDILVSRLDIQCTSLTEIATSGAKFDAAVCEIIEPNGLIKQQAIEDVIFLRGCLLKENGKVIPKGFSVHGMCISSPTLRAASSVTGDDVTLGFKIAEFMNKYQVSTHSDLDLNVLPHAKLTDEFELLSFDFEKALDEEDVPGLCLHENRHKLKICRTGTITAVVYWFKIHLLDDITLSTEANSEGHWHQSSVIFKDEISVEKDDDLIVYVTLNRSNIHIDLTCL